MVRKNPGLPALPTPSVPACSRQGQALAREPAAPPASNLKGRECDDKKWAPVFVNKSHENKSESMMTLASPMSSCTSRSGPRTLPGHSQHAVQHLPRQPPLPREQQRPARTPRRRSDGFPRSAFRVPACRLWQAQASRRGTALASGRSRMPGRPVTARSAPLLFAVAAPVPPGTPFGVAAVGKVDRLLLLAAIVVAAIFAARFPLGHGLGTPCCSKAARRNTGAPCCLPQYSIHLTI